MTLHRGTATVFPSSRPGQHWRRGLAAIAVIPVILAAACGTGARVATPTTPIPAAMTLLVAKAPFGSYLTDSSGRALYMWDADRSGASTCYGACAVEWPPLTVSKAATAGDGIDASLIGTVARTDGTTQVTYGGWPLYYFKPDLKPGELAGQGNTGFGAVWWVVAPNGEPLPSS